MKLIFIFCLFVTIFLGCSKLNDSEKPIISILSPKTNDTISGNNSEVFLEFIASDNIKLASLYLEINDVNGNNYFADTKTLAGQNYSYKNSFLVVKNTKLKALVMKVNIVDEAKNESLSTRTFYLAP
jgi:hypothetical protein